MPITPAVRAVAPWVPSAVNSPKAIRTLAPVSLPVSHGGQPPSATDYAHCTPPGISRPTSTPTTSPSRFSPPFKADCCSRKSSATAVPCKPLSTRCSRSRPQRESDPGRAQHRIKPKPRLSLLADLRGRVLRQLDARIDVQSDGGDPVHYFDRAD